MLFLVTRLKHTVFLKLDELCRWEGNPGPTPDARLIGTESYEFNRRFYHWCCGHFLRYIRIDSYFKNSRDRNLRQNKTLKKRH